MHIQDALTQYESWLGPLTASADLLKARLKASFGSNKAQVQSVSGRVKTVSGLNQKLSRPDKAYARVLDVTDLIAVRVIVYLEDSIYDVAKRIESEFEIDFKNSNNRLRYEDNERFGYRSLHYVCTIPDWCRVPGLPEGMRFEIQIRTLLQHAWAEIEHDLGYKTPDGIPGVMRRRFSQIAGLLEVADREFVNIKKDLSNYETALRDPTQEAFGSAGLDLISVRLLMDHTQIRELDQKISQRLGKPYSEDVFYPDYLLKALIAAGFRDLGAVVTAALENQKLVLEFIPPYFTFAKSEWGFDISASNDVKKGYGLLFLAHLAVLESDSLMLNKVSNLTKFYSVIDYPLNHERAARVGRDLVAALREAKHPLAL